MNNSQEEEIINVSIKKEHLIYHFYDLPIKYMGLKEDINYCNNKLQKFDKKSKKEIQNDILLGHFDKYVIERMQMIKDNLV